MQKNLFCADIAIMANYLFEEMHKSSYLDQSGVDGWIKSTSKKKISVYK